jgi:hypothetical protein
MATVGFDSNSNVDALVSQMILQPSEEDHDLEMYFRKFATDLTLSDDPADKEIHPSSSVVFTDQGDSYPNTVTTTPTQQSKQSISGFKMAADQSSHETTATSPNFSERNSLERTSFTPSYSNPDAGSSLSDQNSCSSLSQPLPQETVTTNNLNDLVSDTVKEAEESSASEHWISTNRLLYANNFSIDFFDCNAVFPQWMPPDASVPFDNSSNYLPPILLPYENTVIPAVDQSLRTRWLNWNSSAGQLSSIPPHLLTSTNQYISSWTSMMTHHPNSSFDKGQCSHIPSVASNGSFSSSASSNFAFPCNIAATDQSLQPIDFKHIDSLPTQPNTHFDRSQNPNPHSSQLPKTYHNRNASKYSRNALGNKYKGNRFDLSASIDKCSKQLRQLHVETNQVSCLTLVQIYLSSIPNPTVAFLTSRSRRST